jgi:biotin carboxyl carrier protein
MQAKINNRICEIELLSKDDNKVEVLLDGKLYEIDTVMAENGFCSILYQGHSYNAEAIRKENEIRYTITTNFQHFDVELSNPQKKYLRDKKAAKMMDVQLSITSPMPGKVIDILVAEGEFLEEGQGAIVVEAMKMQNTFAVSKSCNVKKINVSVGDSVNRDQVLITLE